MSNSRLSELLKCVQNKFSEDAIVSLEDDLAKRIEMHGGKKVEGNLGCSSNGSCSGNNSCSGNDRCSSNAGCSDNSSCSGNG